MWSSSNKKQRSEKVDTLIGQHTELHGDIIFAGGLHVDGRIKGNVIAEKDGATMLVLSEQGVIEGEIRVPYIVINGQVVGDIYAFESVELAQHARITGNVYYNRIEVAMGAEVNGSLVHHQDDAHESGTGVAELKVKQGT